MAFDKISAPSLRETFIHEIENKILSGELKIGEKLPPARELCTLMGVSLTTVSTGLAELTNKGFIEVKPRHGAYVADYINNGTIDTFLSLLRYDGGRLRPNEIRSLTESRLAMDPFVAELVIQRAEDGAIRSLEPTVQALQETERIDEACALVTDFYRELYALSENSFLAMLYANTVEVQKGMYALYFEKNGLALAKSATGEIYLALCRRDTEQAQNLMKTSLRTALEGLTSILNGIAQ